MSGVGGEYLSNCRSFMPRRMLSRSRKPLVVKNPVFGPIPVKTAFVVMVVPCTIVSTFSRNWFSVPPSSRAAWLSPSKKPTVRLPGVVNAL